MTHPVYNPLLSGWLHVLAAPMAVGEDALPVVTWNLDDTGWWRCVDGVPERWLTRKEADQADAVIGRQASCRKPIDVKLLLHRLGLTPFDAPPARSAMCRFFHGNEATSREVGRLGRVLPFRAEPDE